MLEQIETIPLAFFLPVSTKDIWGMLPDESFGAKLEPVLLGKSESKKRTYKELTDKRAKICCTKKRERL
jgi:hypothetical protein